MASLGSLFKVSCLIEARSIRGLTQVVFALVIVSVIVCGDWHLTSFAGVVFSLALLIASFD
jgi:hypothetical protein